ncbi:hypothetical protein DM02DRAFT_627208 [Periconia macrospinosa]|uniref:Mid2 domain-containing protein n=1 Tax=Periconia macrospinosa TaxID=97972 RepID=A0A2V1DUV9_9PLEO|nr:hypothetical protein DM02DRAFT_627208 [Periconia macrospinosa]
MRAVIPALFMVLNLAAGSPITTTLSVTSTTTVISTLVPQMIARNDGQWTPDVVAPNPTPTTPIWAPGQTPTAQPSWLPTPTPSNTPTKDIRRTPMLWIVFAIFAGIIGLFVLVFLGFLVRGLYKWVRTGVRPSLLTGGCLPLPQEA